jgi:hypothetical protein
VATSGRREEKLTIFLFRKNLEEVVYDMPPLPGLEFID